MNVVFAVHCRLFPVCVIVRERKNALDWKWRLNCKFKIKCMLTNFLKKQHWKCKHSHTFCLLNVCLRRENHCNLISIPQENHKSPSHSVKLDANRVEERKIVHTLGCIFFTPFAKKDSNISQASGVDR